MARQFDIATEGAILSQGAGELDPARAAAGCLRAAQRLGTVVASPFEVTGLSSGRREVEVVSKDGITLRASHAIMATGYEMIEGLPAPEVEIVASWAIATKPVSARSFWPRRCLIWEASQPYLYMRSTQDDRILIGGEDMKVSSPDQRRKLIAAKSRRLLAKAQRLLKRDDLELDFAWAGAFAESSNGLPVLRQHPELSRVFTILGAGGNGITFGVIGAAMARAWVEGKRDPDGDLFDGRR